MLVEQTPSPGIEEQEGDLFLLVPEILPVMSGPGNSVIMQPGISDQPCEVDVAGQPQPGLVSIAPPLEEGVLRSSQRATVGQHSNVYRLPRSLGENTPQARSTSNSVYVIFKPWD